MTATPRAVHVWLAVYTFGLPHDVAAERRAEIESDVYEQLHSDLGSTRLGSRLSVIGRAARGAADDIYWRREERRIMKQQPLASGSHGLRSAWSAVTQAWFAPAAAILVLVYLALAVGIALERDGTMPGRAVGPILVLAFACSLVAGLRMRRVQRAGADAGSVESAARATRDRRAFAADGLLIVGTAPGLGFWWMILPPVLGIIVIAGVLSARPAIRRVAAT